MNWASIKNAKWYQKTKAVFSQGLTPWDMSLSIVLGAVIGVIPLFGVATPAITFLAIYLRLNLPLAIFMTYAVSPIHVLLFLPFISGGETILGVEHTPITFDGVKAAFQADFMTAISDLSLQLGYGLVGWVVIGIPVGICIFVIMYFLIKFCHKAIKKEV